MRQARAVGLDISGPPEPEGEAGSGLWFVSARESEGVCLLELTGFGTHLPVI